MTNKDYTTRDFYLAAYLLTSGMELKSSRKENGLTIFVYADAAKAQELVTGYYEQNAKVSAIGYGIAIRNLKAIIHNDIITNRNNNYVEQSNYRK